MGIVDCHVAWQKCCLSRFNDYFFLQGCMKHLFSFDFCFNWMIVGDGNTHLCYFCKHQILLSNIECISYPVMEITKFNIWVFMFSETGNVVCKKYLLVCAVILTLVQHCTDMLDSYRIFSLLEWTLNIHWFQRF